MPNINLDDQNAVDPEAAKYQTMLENLQGNILKGHGRNHTVHVFIKLKAADVKARRDGLGAVAESVVTSAKKQHHESKQYRKWNFTIPGALLITAAIGAMVLTHREHVKAPKTQRELAAQRILDNTQVPPLPAPGVYARHNAVDVPGLLPDGTPAE